jgi:hypothetical protein
MVDKKLTNAFYEIEIDPSKQVPVAMKVCIMTGTKGGATETKGRKITGGKHAVFNFYYTFADYGTIEKPTIPPEAMKLLK